MGAMHERLTWVSPTTLDLTTAADEDVFYCGARPVTIRRVGLTCITDVDATGVTKFDKTNKSGTRGDGDIATINYGTGFDANEVIVKSGLDIELEPGEFITMQVTDATPTAGAASGFIEYEYRDEEIANITQVTETT